MFSTIPCIFGREKDKKRQHKDPYSSRKPKTCIKFFSNQPTQLHTTTVCKYQKKQESNSLNGQNAIFLSNIQISSISTTPQHTNRAIIHQLGATISCDMNRGVSSPARVFLSSSLSKSHRKIQKLSTFCSQPHKRINNQ